MCVYIYLYIYIHMYIYVCTYMYIFLLGALGHALLNQAFDHVLQYVAEFCSVLQSFAVCCNMFKF